MTQFAIVLSFAVLAFSGLGLVVLGMLWLVLSSEQKAKGLDGWKKMFKLLLACAAVSSLLYMSVPYLSHQNFRLLCLAMLLSIPVLGKLARHLSSRANVGGG